MLETKAFPTPLSGVYSPEQCQAVVWPRSSTMQPVKLYYVETEDGWLSGYIVSGMLGVYSDALLPGMADPHSKTREEAVGRAAWMLVEWAQARLAEPCSKAAQKRLTEVMWWATEINHHPEQAFPGEQAPEPSPPGRRYRLKDGRILSVGQRHDGAWGTDDLGKHVWSEGESVGAYTSRALPRRETQAEARADLDEYARRNGLEEVPPENATLQEAFGAEQSRPAPEQPVLQPKLHDDGMAWAVHVREHQEKIHWPGDGKKRKKSDYSEACVIIVPVDGVWVSSYNCFVDGTGIGGGLRQEGPRHASRSEAIHQGALRLADEAAKRTESEKCRAIAVWARALGSGQTPWEENPAAVPDHKAERSWPVPNEHGVYRDDDAELLAWPGGKTRRNGLWDDRAEIRLLEVSPGKWVSSLCFLLDGKGSGALGLPGSLMADYTYGSRDLALQDSATRVIDVTILEDGRAKADGDRSRRTRLGSIQAWAQSLLGTLTDLALAEEAARDEEEERRFAAQFPDPPRAEDVPGYEDGFPGEEPAPAPEEVSVLPVAGSNGIYPDDTAEVIAWPESTQENSASILVMETPKGWMSRPRFGVSDGPKMEGFFMPLMAAYGSRQEALWRGAQALERLAAEQRRYMLGIKGEEWPGLGDLTIIEAWAGEIAWNNTPDPPSAGGADDLPGEDSQADEGPLAGRPAEEVVLAALTPTEEEKDDPALVRGLERAKELIEGDREDARLSERTVLFFEEMREQLHALGVKFEDENRKARDKMEKTREQLEIIWSQETRLDELILQHRRRCPKKEPRSTQLTLPLDSQPAEPIPGRPDLEQVLIPLESAAAPADSDQVPEDAAPDDRPTAEEIEAAWGEPAERVEMETAAE